MLRTSESWPGWEGGVDMRRAKFLRWTTIGATLVGLALAGRVMGEIPPSSAHR